MYVCVFQMKAFYLIETFGFSACRYYFFGINDECTCKLIYYCEGYVLAVCPDEISERQVCGFLCIKQWNICFTNESFLADWFEI